MANIEGNREFTFGTANPSVMENPFWKFMICNPALTSFDERSRAPTYSKSKEPIYCYARFGSTQTYLPDGRLICIGGEHEDCYDPDFQIYNDVVVIQNPEIVKGHSIYAVPVPSNFPAAKEISRDGGVMLGTTKASDVTIYGYPADVFPPIDFHSATYIRDKDKNEYIYIIGGSGYDQNFLNFFPSRRLVCLRQSDRTTVYRLCLSNFSMQRLETSGTVPNSLITHDHSAKLLEIAGRAIIEIRIAVKKIDIEKSEINDIPTTYRLDVETGVWSDQWSIESKPKSNQCNPL